MTSTISTIKFFSTIVALLVVVFCASLDAKLLRRSRYYDNPMMGGYDRPYEGGATGERAIVTVRGARNPYDGSAPSRIQIEDNPYRGPLPRGVYDRLDGGYSGGGRMRDYGYSRGGYGNYMGGGGG